MKTNHLGLNLISKLALSLLLALFFLTNSSLNAQFLYPVKDKRVDSIDLLHTHLKMNFKDLSKGRLNAMAEILLIAKQDFSQLTIDLERLTVDSLFCKDREVSFSQSMTDINLNFVNTVKTGDTLEIEVFYQGVPRRDPGGFGGFYFNGDYAYAIGVGISSDPHPFGRTWFPAFDNFVTKGTYSFEVTTDTGFAAVCGGTLDSSIVKGETVTWYYYLHQPTPSYLISMAVSKYELLEGELNTKQGPIPYILAAQAQDTGALRSSFANFGKAVEAFIHYYGTYNWDRLGYHCVPFNGGAMEHACNISYPLFAVDGSLSREDLMAHELAHSWWGNNITCRTPEDMWINEGWASYSEKLFNEFTYGKARYRQKVEETHRDVLQFAHIGDGDILSVSGVGQEHTYGRHVYRKGADIAHSLRFYMGDSAFFKAIKSIMTSNMYGNMDSRQLMDSFQTYTSNDLESFYKGWVIGKGFTHLSVKTWNTRKLGSEYQTEVGILQRNRWDGTPHETVPVEVYLLKPDFTFEIKRVLATKFQSNFQFNTNYEPLAVGLDIDAKLSDATTDTFRMVENPGIYNFEDGLMEVEAVQVPEKTFLHITHHWIGADNSTSVDALPVLSRDRYWSVEGYIPDGFKAKATVQYNGQTARLSGDFFLDNQLVRGNEDSLVLMYRPDALSSWNIADAELQTGNSKFDRLGSFIINDLKAGEYTMAIYNQALATGSIKNSSDLVLYPNPTDGLLHVEFKSFTEPGYIMITDSTGKIVLKKAIRNTQNNMDLNTENWSAGTYKVLLTYPDGNNESASFSVIK